MTVGRYIEKVYQQFDQAELYYGHGTDNAWDEAVFLVTHVLGFPPSCGDHVLAHVITAEQQQAINDIAQARIKSRKPLAYLLNTAWFAGHRFYINEHVLVPRSPLAELIADHFHPWLDINSAHHALDLCTGSGCIAIALAQQYPHLMIDASDICPQALTVAQRNIHEHKLAERVKLIESNLFQAIPTKRYDLIISNPPYVDAQDMAILPAEYRQEPELGLASGHDGLDATRMILRDAANYLTETGYLIVEVGNSQHALNKAFPKMPWTWLEFEHGGDGVFLLSYQDLIHALESSTNVRQ